MAGGFVLLIGYAGRGAGRLILDNTELRTWAAVVWIFGPAILLFVIAVLTHRSRKPLSGVSSAAAGGAIYMTVTGFGFWFLIGWPGLISWFLWTAGPLGLAVAWWIRPWRFPELSVGSAGVRDAGVDT